MKYISLIIILSCCIIIGCSNTGRAMDNNKLTSISIFKSVKSAPNAFTRPAKATGILKIEDNCLYFYSYTYPTDSSKNKPAQYITMWPWDTFLSESKGKFVIISKSKGIVATIGETITLSGGMGVSKNIKLTKNCRLKDNFWTFMINKS